MSAREHRGTIFLEQAEILDHRDYPGEQHVLRVHAPAAARTAEPGSFAHITCHPAVPLRRPLSIMRAEPQAGWLEFLYKPVGQGLAALSARTAGETLSVLAPIGRGFALASDRPKVLAIGGGVGIPPMIFLSERLRADPSFEPLVLMGSEVPFPFEVTPATHAVGGAPTAATHCVTLLESWGIPSRLASNAGLDGCYPGTVIELAREWLAALPGPELGSVQVFGCGPQPMLRALAELVLDYDLPCQLALEEYMACGTGGCAGCTVLIRTDAGLAMKRVCVDGPVFDARAVVFNRS
jgi:dihydroorotate dehydrogenase electron transfer subunit